MAPVVVLVGAPGCGKTTVGGRSPPPSVWSSATPTPTSSSGRQADPEIFIDEGEAHFRTLERAAVAAALAGGTGVLALGGGAILAEETRAALSGTGWSTSRSSCPTR